MRSCLEIYSMDGTTTLPYGRHQQEIRSDYQRTNQYSETHNDALGNGLGTQHSGDGHTYTMGRGTGNAPHIDWLPDCHGQMGTYIAGFDVDIASNAGNEEDKAARNQAFTRSLYSYIQPYDYTNIDTALNVQEGQYVLPNIY